MAVGELFLGAFLQVLFQKLADGAVMALARRERIDSHFNKLQKSYIYIKAVLVDAEDKQLTMESVKVWLEDIRDAAYDLDDLLDEIITRALVQDSKGFQHHKTSVVCNFIPTWSRFMPGALVSNYKLMSRIKAITKRLDHIAKQRSDLNLRENIGGFSSRPGVIRSESTSVVLESEVYGRDEDKEAIKEMLRVESSSENFSVIPIVGMGGIGKTTLAQLVYNDKDVIKDFHVRAWVCVSEVFDVLKITKTIYESVTKRSGQAKDLDMLQVSLQEKLSKRKFLIVLDDVWNESYVEWHKLCLPFVNVGLSGSRIIVTTRNDTVALVVGSPRSAYHMKLLTDEDCLSLLAQHARASFQERSDLREVGQGLIKKCKGLPLAAKVLGGILRTKNSESEWRNVLNSKIWDLPKENDILPVLRLSYHHLPSHLKHPFAYCSVFPKDYEFDKNELVCLWMGESFLESTNEHQKKEDLGHEYFNELLSRSLFQRVSGSESNFVMHDLINDLAHFVSGGACCRLDEKLDTNQEYQLPTRTRHTSFLRHEYEVFQKFERFRQFQGLRTFLPMPVQNSLVWPPFYLSNRILVELVPRLIHLRVLSLSGYSITELPSSICSLIHLRYLNLSGTSILTLPSSISDLFNLQTLSLSNCRFIHKLPPTLGDLSNLRHLDISNTDLLKDMPVEIGKLRNLQTLPKIILSGDGGLGLKELRFLKHLRGTLAIFELQNIVDLDDAKEATLGCKDEIDDLQLSWGSDISNFQGKSLEDVIDLLRPHQNLSKLKIESYRGPNFPVWIGDPLYRKLSSMILINCTECVSLPPLGQLPELKHLRIGGMPRIKGIGIEFYGNGAEAPFQKLETLRFDHMLGWEKWSAFAEAESLIHFPLLRQLTMFKCNKLNVVSPLSLPSLQELDIEGCSIVLLKSFRNLDALNYLKVESITGLSHLPMELMVSLATLDVLEFCSCNEMLALWPNGISLKPLTKLRRMVIAECSQLVSLGEGAQQLPCSLEVLELFRCGSLTSLSNDLSNLGSLRELIIKNCAKFVDFPQKGIPPALKRLEILSCNGLKSLPGDISMLERLEIKECSSLKTWKMVFPTTLKKLSIKNCTSLEPVTEFMFPQNNVISLEDLSLSNWPNFNNFLHRLYNFSHLFELYLSKCYGLKSFPEQGLPPNLRALSVEECQQLRSFPTRFRSMTCLTSLEIRSCPKLENFPNCDFPPNLSSLRIWDSKKFKPLNTWGLHRLESLQEFSICGGFKDLDLLGDTNLFPPSLVRFSIARFPMLNSISKVLENLVLLRHLSVMNCGKLSLLPSEQLLEKLWHLEISECPLLSQRCLKDKGEFWPMIAGVPCVKIDGNHVYQQRD
ncbi:putative disease resistance RPP13-like protein 1 [Henckelia pumila]|uniref:putative disease resistance RPP13-like protein 1 n=1 Tax=Henckelia pumila TaxID=405737 RepID=UPI003C6E9314